MGWVAKVPRARRALQTSFSLGETLIRTIFVSKMTVFGLTEVSRVRCSVEFLQIFLKQVAAREQFSAAVSVLYTELQKIFARLHLRNE